MIKKISKQHRKIIFFVFLLLIPLAFYRGQYISFKDQWILFDALRTTSSIVFAVIGAWFAIVYPERLRFKKSPHDSTTNNGETNFDRFFLPLVASSIILIIILIIGIIVPVTKTISFFLEFRNLGRAFSYAILTTLTLIQIWSIVQIIVLSSIIKSIADEHDTKEKMKENINKAGTTLDQDDFDKIEVKIPD